MKLAVLCGLCSTACVLQCVCYWQQRSLRLLMITTELVSHCATAWHHHPQFNRLDKRAGFAAMIVANVTALGPCSMCEKHLASVGEFADFVFIVKVQQRHSIGMLPNRTLLKAYLCNAWCNDSHHRHTRLHAYTLLSTLLPTALLNTYADIL